MQGNRKQRGITLIEVATTSTVLAIAVGTVVPSFSGMLARRAVEGTATQLAGDLQYIRSEAVARNTGLRIGFASSPAGSCYVIHTGAAGDCACDPAAATVCVAGATELKTVPLPAGTRAQLQTNIASMLFHPVRGTTTPAGTLRVVGTNGEELRHVVNIMGRTRSCSPNGSIKGYPVC